MKKAVPFLLALFFTSYTVFAQGTAGSDAKFEYRYLVDMPTAGVLGKGFVGFTARNMPNGVVIAKIEAAVFENFSFGFSYGGSNVIGRGKVNWYPLPGLNVRFRVLNETQEVPAVTVGFDSQGRGEYFTDFSSDTLHAEGIERYEIKSPGFFAAAAKTFDFLGYFVLHGAINYSLERNDDDKSVNFMFGFEKTVGPQVSFIAEYNFAINDNEKISIGDGDGYLNAGLRWSVGDGFTLGFDLRDLLDNKKISGARADRGVFVEFIKSIL